MKKKIMALVLTAAMCMTAVTGCGSAEGGQQAETASADKVYHIGVCQLLEHPALDAATQGFKDALVAKLGDKVTFDVQNAQGEQATAATICNGLVADNVDLIMANATTPLQAAAAATTTIPILGTSVTDYGTALEVENWSGVSGRNISGTSDLAPIDEQENMLVEIFPNAQKVGLLYCTAEANSKYQIELFKAALEEDGIAYQEYGIADTNEVQSVVTTAAEECDVVYIPTDNTLANVTETVYNILIPAGVPCIAGEEGICSGCGVATLSISYYDLGYTTGEMAAEILLNGADITTMPVKFAPNVTKKYNASICNELGITVPDDYVAISE
jgi:putative ABC transport system substrate-binding protein